MTMEDAKFVADSEQWDHKKLGADNAYVGVATEDEMNQAMTALGLKLISIRMPVDLIEDLKLIAKANRVGYQPLIRDVLKRFVDGEKKQVLRETYDLMRETVEKQVADKEKKQQKKAA